MSWKDDIWGVNTEADVDVEYTIVADYGKPYDIKVKNKKDLKKELKKLKQIYEEGDHPFFDIWVYDRNNKDITNECIKDGEILI